MDLQEELSRSAQDPSIIALQKQQEAERIARENADKLATEITSELKRQLVENVQQGHYTQKYNKGTVTAGYFIPGNKYLQLKSASSYNRKHIEIARSYCFLVKAAYTAEFNHLRQRLDEWGTENNVEVKWGITASNDRKPKLPVFLLYPFPCEEMQSVPPRTWIHYFLSVQAVAHFPIDTSLPVDYMSDEEIKTKRTSLQSELQKWKDDYSRHRISCIISSIFCPLFSIATIALLCSGLSDIGWSLIIFAFWAFVSFGGIVNAMDSIKIDKKRIEEIQIELSELSD